jgi:hypothetical protein
MYWARPTEPYRNTITLAVSENYTSFNWLNSPLFTRMKDLLHKPAQCTVGRAQRWCSVDCNKSDSKAGIMHGQCWLCESGTSFPGSYKGPWGAKCTRWGQVGAKIHDLGAELQRRTLKYNGHSPRKDSKEHWKECFSCCRFRHLCVFLRLYFSAASAL